MTDAMRIDLNIIQGGAQGTSFPSGSASGSLIREFNQQQASGRDLHEFSRSIHTLARRVDSSNKHISEMAQVISQAARRIESGGPMDRGELQGFLQRARDIHLDFMKWKRDVDDESSRLSRATREKTSAERMSREYVARGDQQGIQRTNDLAAQLGKMISSGKAPYDEFQDLMKKMEDERAASAIAKREHMDRNAAANQLKFRTRAVDDALEMMNRDLRVYTQKFDSEARQFVEQWIDALRSMRDNTTEATIENVKNITDSAKDLMNRRMASYGGVARPQTILDSVSNLESRLMGQASRMFVGDEKDRQIVAALDRLSDQLERSRELAGRGELGEARRVRAEAEQGFRGDLRLVDAERRLSAAQSRISESLLPGGVARSLIHAVGGRAGTAIFDTYQFGRMAADRLGAVALAQQEVDALRSARGQDTGVDVVRTGVSAALSSQTVRDAIKGSPLVTGRIGQTVANWGKWALANPLKASIWGAAIYGGYQLGKGLFAGGRDWAESEEDRSGQFSPDVQMAKAYRTIRDIQASMQIARSHGPMMGRMIRQFADESYERRLWEASKKGFIADQTAMLWSNYAENITSLLRATAKALGANVP